jgi:alkanesulfonate monooxygenase SsuD/methylene tetrahydromethanopterin reductase-like flavin-dependent oxidoreductase (luciferase family)
VRPPLIGLSITEAFLRGGTSAIREVVAAAECAGLDYLQVGDHVSFHGGAGYDGLVHAAAALSMQDRLPVQIGLYLLALRHPVLVARQLADLERLAPGRVIFGVGVGGEDRHEFDVTGVDPATRGRRTDESIDLLRRLLHGQPVTARGQFFDLDDAVIAPPPGARVPVLIGGRSEAALRRVAHRGDGWLALWHSPARYAEAVRTIEGMAAEIGRADVRWRHGLNLWCAIDTDVQRARCVLAAAMWERYQLPFDRFARWCPAGTARDVAAVVARYAEVGCGHVTLVPQHPDLIATVEAAAEVRRLVTAGCERAQVSAVERRGPSRCAPGN